MVRKKYGGKGNMGEEDLLERENMGEEICSKRKYGAIKI